MSLVGWLQIGLLFTLLAVLIKPLGLYMARVFSGERTLLAPGIAPLETAFYKIAGVRPDAEQSWRSYAFALLAFNMAGFVLLYAILRLQGSLPFNPQGFGGMPADLAFNTAVSFVTNTNWQAYGGETTMSYLVEMAGLTVQNFLSAATGIAVAVALIRALARRSVGTVGNFHVDLVRSILHVLLPVCLIGALILVWQGVPQNLTAYTQAITFGLCLH